MKYHILLTVLATQIAALCFGETRAPYFPIEISRTAAANSFSYAALLCGAVTMALHFPQLSTNQSTNATWAMIWAWFGFILVAACDDVTSWVLHMIGVGMLVSGASILCYISNDYNESARQAAIICMSCCCLLFLLRLVLKTLVVVGVELEHSVTSFRTWESFVLNKGGLRTSVVQKSMDIMYNGPTSCKYPQYTMVIFKAAGVMQWLFFWMLVELTIK